LKQPKLYTHHRRGKQARRPARRAATAKGGAENISVSGRMDEIRNLSREIFSATSKMEKWLTAITNLSYALEDKKAFQKFLTSLSKMDLNPSDDDKKDSSNQSTASSPKKSSHLSSKPYSTDGESLYDLINSPGMAQMVDTIMKNRQANKKRK